MTLKLSGFATVIPNWGRGVVVGVFSEVLLPLGLKAELARQTPKAMTIPIKAPAMRAYKTSFRIGNNIGQWGGLVKAGLVC